MLFVFAAIIFPNQTSRCVIITHAAALAGLLVLVGNTRAANELIDLRPQAQTSNRNAKVVVEVEGKLKLNPDGKEVQHLPLKVTGELNYSERVITQTRQWTEAKLARYYHSAEAKLTLRDTKFDNRLRPERRLIVVESGAKAAQLFSPEGPLQREELELLETIGSGLALESLLPPRVMKVGGSWELPDSVVARLLGMEAVNKQDCVLKLDSAKDHIAEISLTGKVAGAVGGVSSDIELKGKLNFDLKQRAVTWLALACRENREIGHAQPGFEVLTTLRLVSAPAKPIAELSDKALAGLPLSATTATTLLDLTSESARYQLLHDRRWQVMVERHDVTILRMVDRGDLIAQCNLSPRPPLGKDEQLTLEGFQEDIKRILGQNFDQIVAGGEEVENGIRVLRVIVAGKTSELPIQWMYYHLSDEHGHRAAIVFTIESSLLDRYPQIDRQFISGFRFLPDKQPTPAVPGPQSAAKPAGTKVDR